MENHQHKTYWEEVWDQYRKHRLGMLGLIVVALFVLVAIYAPFLASSKPIVVYWQGEWYFPLFRSLFYSGFYSKKIDLFFNLMIFTFPLGLILFFALIKHSKRIFLSLLIAGSLQSLLFIYLLVNPPTNPAANSSLNGARLAAIEQCTTPGCYRSWQFNIEHMTPYAKLNLILQYHLRREQQEALQPYIDNYLNRSGKRVPPTLFQRDSDREAEQKKRLTTTLIHLGAQGKEGSPEYLIAQSKLQFLIAKRNWLEEQNHSLQLIIMPFFRSFHWEDDAGGGQSFNQYIPWWEITRINRKDLIAALIFGVRISLVVGILAVVISMAIGIPVGAYAGYYGGAFDIFVSRLLEIWESMPSFFMLLMIVAITQTKSIFLIIMIVGIFGWTGFSRYIRGEFFKQRNLPYVEACHALGFHDSHIIFSHILPNAIPPLLTLLPFAVMGAITSEAGLSFLGLGEEGSCSWGVLMDEGRSAFPAESYLLWPPATLLTLLLISIALVGDTLRDALDPKLHTLSHQ